MGRLCHDTIMDPAELQPAMTDEVSLHVVYPIVNAPIRMFPFPHICVRDVFPPEFARQTPASAQSAARPGSSV